MSMSVSMNNLKVRQAIAKKRLKYYELAAALNIDPATLSRWLRVEMKPDQRDKVLKAIENFKL